ncbi:MAG: hypothetical protein AAB415_01520 [Patescibacteria group bacterium]
MAEFIAFISTILHNLTWHLNVSLMGGAFAVFSLAYNDYYIYYGLITFAFGIFGHIVYKFWEWVFWDVNEKHKYYWLIQLSNVILGIVWVTIIMFIYSPVIQNDMLSGLPETKINGDIYTLSWYGEEKFQDENHPYKPAGFMVFKLLGNRPTLFWESKEETNNNGKPRFEDINNDEVDEIVWEGDLSVTGRTNAFYIYKFVGNTFKRISPLQKDSTDTYLLTELVGSAELTFMKDIDADKIQDIIVGYEQSEGKKIAKIFKWNGSEYSLWKEVAESSPEFKELFK